MVSKIIATVIGVVFFGYLFIGMPIQLHKQEDARISHQLHTACLQGGGTWNGQRCKQKQ